MSDFGDDGFGDDGFGDDGLGDDADVFELDALVDAGDSGPGDVELLSWAPDDLDFGDPVAEPAGVDVPLDFEPVEVDAGDAGDTAADLDADLDADLTADVLQAVSWDSVAAEAEPAAGWLDDVMPRGWTAVALDPAVSVWSAASTEPVEGFVDPSLLDPP